MSASSAGQDADGTHPGAASGFGAGGCVLDDDTPRCGDADFRGGTEKDLRIGLAAFDVFGGDDGREATANAEHVEDGFDV